MQALRQVDILKKQLDELLPMKEEYKRELDKKIRLEFNYNSNHLEGNTFTYGETKLLLIFGQTSAGKTIRDTEEMKAHDVAYKMITEWAADKEYVLTERDIKNLNRIILVEPFKKATKTPDGQPSSRIINIGDYKQQSNSVETATGEIFEFASPVETPAKMGDLMQWYRDEEEKGEFDAVSLAALFHYRFVRIHPFDDGNGRISRLLMNYILLKNGYPPVVIKSADKHNYFAALRMADADDLEAFVQYIAEQLQWSLGLFIKAANGESVDEPGDLDKKLTALKRRINNIYDDKINRSPEILRECLEASILPLIESIYKVLNKFDPFFVYKTISIGYAKTIGSSTNSFTKYWDNYIDFKSAILVDPNDIKGVNFYYELRKIKNSYNDSYLLETSVRVTFLDSNYEIVIEDINLKMSLNYDEIIITNEIARIAENVGSFFYNSIESKLEN